MEPLLEDVPERIESPRLLIRVCNAADAPALNAAVCESLEALRPYMPWAQTPPTLAHSAAECRRMQARFLLREDLPMFMFERDARGGEGAYVGGIGLHRIDWQVRRFEIGYWCRSSRVGQGFVSEAVAALTQLTFDELRARRIELRTDDSNQRSWRVAERAGFTLEGVLRCQALTPQGEPRDTRIYAKLRAAPI
jgi:RimJ/RimL family protein N-acetyltransferase